jgi:3-hydroxy acid dehydrogenase/malonic semialdehyde reductase
MAKIALITGATAGIGEACAHTFAREGYNLILTGRRMQRLERLALLLNEKYNVEVAISCFDVRSKAQVIENLQGLPEEWKQVDVLVNNAGLSQGLDPIDKGSYDDWETMIDTNIKGLLYVSRVVSNWMIDNGFGHIINLGFYSRAKRFISNGNVYCATKHAVDALNKGMRLGSTEPWYKGYGNTPGRGRNRI